MRAAALLVLLWIPSLTLAQPASPTVCKLKVESGHVLSCDRSNNNKCVIRMSTLDCLENEQADQYVIGVRKGETVKWLGNLDKKDKNNKRICDDAHLPDCPKIHFEPFKPHSKDATCGEPDTTNPPFDDKFDHDVDPQGKPKYESMKNSKVSTSATSHSCFSHNITMDDKETIDPHIMVEDAVTATTKKAAKKHGTSKPK